MTDFIDTYVKSVLLKTLEDACAEYENVIEPAFKNGFWYSCIRTTAPIVITNPLVIPVLPAEGIPACGVWA